MFKELIKDLRHCATSSEACASCNRKNQRYCQDHLHAESADAIEQLEAAVPKWIPVMERLPEKAGKYLVSGRGRGKQTEIWVCDFVALNCLKGWANNAANPSVSHWMPLPEPLKEEAE